MEDKGLNELKHMILYISELNKKELEKLDKVVDRVIKWKIQDEQTVSMVFDQLLSVMFVDEEELKRIYYKLLNYTKTFDEELSNDYEDIFIEQRLEIEEELEETKININKKPIK